jgi:hypothetical protein
MTDTDSTETIFGFAAALDRIRYLTSHGVAVHHFNPRRGEHVLVYAAAPGGC